MEHVTPTNEQLIIDAIKKITGYMNLQCHIEVRQELIGDQKTLTAALYTPENARFLIGKNGQNLKALEQVLRSVLSRSDSPERPSVLVDVNDYRKSRALELVQSARQSATRVRNTQKAEALGPMSSYERRIVHTELAACPDISTESIGEEPQRRVVIKPFP